MGAFACAEKIALNDWLFSVHFLHLHPRCDMLKTE